MHSHCHEISINELISSTKNMNIVCVSDDLSSSRVTVEIAKRYDVIPCIGIHPWNVGEGSLRELDMLVELLLENDVECLGEVGLDRKFRWQTYSYQYKLLTKLLELSREYDLVLNLHCAGAWREVYKLVVKYSIDRAYFHWYSGPKDLVSEIAANGYYIGINPAWRVQERHREIIDVAPLSNVLTESDSPYKYKGLYMNSRMVVDTVKYIAERKNTSVDSAIRQISGNFYKLFKR